ncbi:hypothetical protein IFM89_005052 [Coptis chinensis]|uniref:Uncharacterized protein n=1 Tax=Coptis chinensis TaxID=261450 RepID=A0A835HLJ6_9MAGN|nr:hypothetical protein IFM89_005052 [Coptis chinensis]
MKPGNQRKEKVQRLKTTYLEKIVPLLKDTLFLLSYYAYTNMLEVPKVEKIVVNVGLEKPHLILKIERNPLTSIGACSMLYQLFSGKKARGHFIKAGFLQLLELCGGYKQLLVNKQKSLNIASKHMKDFKRLPEEQVGQPDSQTQQSTSGVLTVKKKKIKDMIIGEREFRKSVIILHRYFVWAVSIANLARIGYEEKTMYMVAYDWRVSFQHTEAVMNIGGPFLGVPKAISGVLFEAKDVLCCRCHSSRVKSWIRKCFLLGPVTLAYMKNFCASLAIIAESAEVPCDNAEIAAARKKESKEEDLSPAEKDHKKRVVLTGRFGSKRDQAKTCMVEEDEVMAAIKDLDGEKAPGIDAFP